MGWGCWRSCGVWSAHNVPGAALDSMEAIMLNAGGRHVLLAHICCIRTNSDPSAPFSTWTVCTMSAYCDRHKQSVGCIPADDSGMCVDWVAQTGWSTWCPVQSGLFRGKYLLSRCRPLVPIFFSSSPSAICAPAKAETRLSHERVMQNQWPLHLMPPYVLLSFIFGL